MVKSHPLDRFRQPHRLQRVEGLGRPMRDRAVRTIAGTDITQDHEGGGLVIPAFTDIGATRLFAHGVQSQLAHRSLDVRIIGAAGRLNLEPTGFPRGGRRGGRSVRQLYQWCRHCALLVLGSGRPVRNPEK